MPTATTSPTPTRWSGSRIAARSPSATARPTARSTARGNPNGSTRNIAGIFNETKTVLGLMPHPENAVEPLFGGTDGKALFAAWSRRCRERMTLPRRTRRSSFPTSPRSRRRSWPSTACRPTNTSALLEILGRTPTLTELGIFSAMWSEHCSYKSSKVWLKKLPTKAPWVIHGPGENAGVIDIGDGQAAIFKMESHNHPSFIEPYQGAATGVGGILRDVFTMGARPIANLNALRFGSPDHPKTRHLVSGVVAGIGGYGNCVGVPTVGGETNFHPAYNGNILVNAMSVGHRADRPHLLFGRRGRRQSGGLCRRQDRPRRHPRRDHGLGRVRRGRRGEAPDRAGRRSVHREAADRGLPRADGDRRDRRDPGHGRGRA